MNAEAISKWLGILAALGVIWARFVTLEERTVRGYLTAAETRISALERDRAMLERVHQIELRLGSMEEQLKERRR
jgi:hypothetical protein